jgi:hypothetical protein
MDVWPLTFKAGLEYDRFLKEVNATAECRDAFFGGEFSLDALHRAVEYSKTFDVGGVTQITLKGRCDVGDLFTPSAGAGVGNRKGSGSGASGGDGGWNASFGFSVEPKVTEHSKTGVKGSFIGTKHGYDVICEAPLSDLISAEVCGHFTVPAPRAEFAAHTGGGGRVSLGRGSVTAHDAQINVVVTL